MMSIPTRIRRCLTPCPACGSDRFVVYGTAVSKIGRRSRRWVCQDCGFRKSTVEVDMADYDRLIDAERFRAKVFKWLHKGGESGVAAGRSCRRDCVHFTDGKCGFGFPEAQSDSADDCSMFTARD